MPTTGAITIAARLGSKTDARGRGSQVFMQSGAHQLSGSVEGLDHGPGACVLT